MSLFLIPLVFFMGFLKNMSFKRLKKVAAIYAKNGINMNIMEISFPIIYKKMMMNIYIFIKKSDFLREKSHSLKNIFSSMIVIKS